MRRDVGARALKPIGRIRAGVVVAIGVVVLAGSPGLGADDAELAAARDAFDAIVRLAELDRTRYVGPSPKSMIRAFLARGDAVVRRVEREACEAARRDDRYAC